MDNAQQFRFRIGAFLVDPAVDELRRDGTVIKIERRSMEVLQYLAARDTNVVSVEELLDAVWSDVVVTPDSVYRAITALRRAFDDDARAPEYIISVPRRGYRLGHPVVREDPPEPKAGALAPAASVAVLPFVDLSEKQDHGYFSDGLSEELIHLLAQLPDLRVPARTSSFHFKGRHEEIAVIARRLRVAHVLEGSVRTAGRRIRVTAQLIRADSGYHVWSNTYDRDLEDVFRVQDEIAAAVVDALKSRLVPPRVLERAHRLTNRPAYEQFLSGRRHFLRGHEQDFERGVEAYRQAIDLEPRYAAAYAGLALAEAYLSDARGDYAAQLRARDAADTAIELAPDLVDGYTARATLRLVFFWDWPGAQHDLAHALSIAAGDSLAHRQQGKLLRSLGRFPEAIESGRKAADLDPLSNFVWEGLGNSYAAAGDLAAARDAYERALQLEPATFYAADGLAIVELLSGRPAEALARISRVDVGRAFRLPGIAMAEHSLGHADASQRALQAAIDERAHRGAYDIGVAFCWRGDHDEAMRWLTRAHAQRERGLSEVNADPLLHALHADPRFRELLRKMDLPPR